MEDLPEIIYITKISGEVGLTAHDNMESAEAAIKADPNRVACYKLPLDGAVRLEWVPPIEGYLIDQDVTDPS